MDDRQAQKKMYLLSEALGELKDKADELRLKIDAIKDERLKLLCNFPTLDIRRPSRLPVRSCGHSHPLLNEDCPECR